MALEKNKKGKLYSIDFPVYQKSEKREKGIESWALPFGKSSGWAIPKRLKSRWDLSIGRSEDILPELSLKLGHFDLFCHDSPVRSAHLAFEMDVVRKAFKPSSTLIADNADANMRAVQSVAKFLGAEVYPRRHSSCVAFRVPNRSPRKESS